MDFDCSIKQFIRNPTSHHLVLEGATLKAVRGNPLCHELSQKAFRQLRELAHKNAKALRVLNTIRWIQHDDRVNHIFSSSLNISNEASFGKEVPMPLQRLLDKWCEAKIGTPQYRFYLQAVRKIQTCYRNSGETLDLSHLELNSLPDIFSFFTSLKELNLKGNPLGHLPESMGTLIHLKVISINNCSFERLPHSIRGLRSLSKLFAHNNRIREIPSWIGELRNLSFLYMGSNPFSTLPDSLSNLPNLRCLSLVDNQLTHHPRCFLLLSPSVQIHLTGGNIHTRKAETSTVGLETLFRQKINEWKLLYKKCFPGYPNPLISLQSSLSASDKKVILMYLDRLTDTKDYSHFDTRPQVVLQAIRAFEGASSHPVFKEKMIDLMLQATGSCGDKIAVYTTSINVAWEVHCNGRHHPEDVAKLLLGNAKLDLIKEFVLKTLKGSSVDDVEVVLYCQLHLKDTLNLPLTVEKMLFENLGSEVGSSLVEPARMYVLEHISSRKQQIKILLNSPDWTEYIPRQFSEFQEIDARINTQMDALGLPTEENQFAFAELHQQRNTERFKLSRKITKSLIKDHWRDMSS